LRINLRRLARSGRKRGNEMELDELVADIKRSTMIYTFGFHDKGDLTGQPNRRDVIAGDFELALEVFREAFPQAYIDYVEGTRAKGVIR